MAVGCVNWQLQSWPHCSFGLGDVFVNASLVIDVLASRVFQSSHVMDSSGGWTHHILKRTPKMDPKKKHAKPTEYCPSVIRWLVNLIKYSYSYHKP